MNKTFHSVWNASKQAYVAAAETVSAKGKPSSSVKLAATLTSLMVGLLANGAYAQTAPPPTALPSGGQVSAGQARIGQGVTALPRDPAGAGGAVRRCGPPAPAQH